MTTIPVGQLINVTPNVLPAGGDALFLNGLILTTSTGRVPYGSVQSFPTAAAVATFFGASSKEASLASVYFNGYIGASATPGALLFTTYPNTAIAAFLRGSSVASLTLTQLQVLSGTLNLTVDGYARNVANISLAAAVSFSNAATIMQTALNGSAPANLSSFTGSLAGGTMTVTGLTSGTINPGTTVNGTGLSSPSGVIILAQLSGSTGGTGTYTVTSAGTLGSQTLSTAAVPITVTYDSVSGGFLFTSGNTGNLSSIQYATGLLATSLNLTQATGGVISQGTAAGTPGPFMSSIINITQNWALFMTAFNPDSVVGVNTNKLLFALWTSQQNDRYGYVAWDTDASPTVTVPAASSLGQEVIAAGYSGTFCIWEPSETYVAAFILGIAAALDFSQTNGRATFAYRSQSGLTPGVTDPTTASNLIANGYNFYGAYATANQNFQWLQPGSVSGPFVWMDSYVNQIQMNAQFQLTLADLESNTGSIPYTPAGYSIIANSLLTPINAALNFGTIRAGVTLTSSEILEINSVAGNNNAANAVSTRGWYLQVSDPGAAVRIARGSPVMNFWYADGEAVQMMSLNSIDVQ
jgi:hypothetical protein